jgi:hypothetical protein
MQYSTVRKTPGLSWTYKNETGVIVSEYNTPLAIIDGGVGSVEFPSEFIWDIHRARPGHVLKLAHTHPTNMWSLSERDQQTLKTWAFAMHPFPMRLSTICFMEDEQNFLETVYLGLIEPKEVWLARGKGERKFTLIVEDAKVVYPDTKHKNSWKEWIITKSYGRP